MPSEIQLKILSHDMVLKFRGLNPLNSELLGAAELDSMTVSVREALPLDLRSSTVLHECVHIIEKMFQLEFTETQVDCLAIGMFSLLKENPHLIELLFGHARHDREAITDVRNNSVPAGYVAPPVYAGKEPKT